MLKKLLLLFLIITPAMQAQYKSKFDLAEESLFKSVSPALVNAGGTAAFNNGTVGATMIPGAYFTIGTASGLSTGTLDDNCQITFGHPYGLTSYPVFSVDGQWYKFDEYFTSSENTPVSKSGDTLKLMASGNSLISAEFLIYFQSSDQSIRIVQNIKNLDSKAHNVGLGLVLDPALGKTGDGNIYLQNGFLSETKIFQDIEIPSVLSLWEKSTGAKGIGVDISASENPVKIIASNWKDSYNVQSPDFDNSTPQKLYDLLVKFYWDETSLAPGSVKSISSGITLKQPDFSSSYFLRWDLPQFLSMDNKILFPKDITSYVTLDRSGNKTLSNASLKFDLPVELTVSPAQYTYGSTLPVYQKVKVNARSVYEDRIAEITAKIFEGGQVIDELHRFVMIPATPVSDTGLVVKIDTLMTSKLPQVALTFEVAKKDIGTKIPNLTDENVFLYENSQRINSFIFGKDTSGGSMATDIIFALDVTGSMGGEIDGVKRNIVEFADSLSASGIDYRLGLVTFLDAVENTYPFTKDAQAFQTLIGQQYAHGGDDTPENSLQALWAGANYSFRPDAKRIIIWITDANYHENDAFTSLTKGKVIDALLLQGITVHAIGSLEYKSSYYDPIINATGGNYYNILGNFRDILLDVSRMKSVFRYLISYTSPNAVSGTKQITLKIRYAGLGGEASTFFSSAMANQGNANENHLLFYPNPFNSSIVFKITKGTFKSGTVKIFNILGQQVKQLQLTGNETQNISWDARNEQGGQLTSGSYIAELSMTDKNNSIHVETVKILYLK